MAKPLHGLKKTAMLIFPINDDVLADEGGLRREQVDQQVSISGRRYLNAHFKSALLQFFRESSQVQWRDEWQ